jgi:pimeloyl-ACP methyl ester carboxylesterase
LIVPTGDVGFKEEAKLLMSDPVEQIVDCGGHMVTVLRGGTGRPVLILHDELGWPGWTSWCERMAGNFELIVPLQPGFGQSDRIRWIRSYRDLALFYCRLVRQMELDPIDVVGFSAGGYVAAEMAACSPQTVNRLGLVAPMGIKPQDDSIADFLAMTIGQHLSLTLERSDAPDASHIYGGEMTPEQFELFADARAETARLGWEPFMYDPTLPFHLEAIGELPAQLIWGTKDKIVPRQCIDAYAAALPDAQVELLEGVGHRPETEVPDQFVATLEAFLSEVPKPAHV